MRKTWFLVAALGLALAGPASAAPSFFGPTGLLVIPTADTLAPQSWNVHLHLTDDIITYGANFGLAKQLELGLTGFDPDGGDTSAMVNAKYTLLMETGKAPGIAVGGIDLIDELDLDVGFYIVASKSLNSLLGGEAAKHSLNAHLGYGWNSIFNDDVFWGLDLAITPQIQAILEGIGGDVTFGARIGLGAGIRAELASYDGEIGGGISYAAALR